jgi:cold-inducible RNA-binding protein
MSAKLFVGGLSWDTNDAGLRAAFEGFGEVVEAVVINDRETGRSRGFGFVTFASEDEAQRAAGEMDGREIDGRSVRVNIAEERGRGGHDRGPGGRPPRVETRGGPRGGGFGGGRSDGGGRGPGGYGGRGDGGPGRGDRAFGGGRRGDGPPPAAWPPPSADDPFTMPSKNDGRRRRERSKKKRDDRHGGGGRWDDSDW